MRDFLKVLAAFVLSCVSMVAGMQPSYDIFQSWSPSISFGAALLVVLLFGRKFILAIPRIFVRSDMNTLIGLGIVAAFALSIYQWSRGAMHLYFDSAAFISTFVLLGQIFETRSLSKIREHLSRLQKLLPERARRLTANGTEDVDLNKISIGDKLIIASGDRLPADGRLLTSAIVDLSTLTGESKPQTLAVGDSLFQGALNVGQAFQIEVIEVSEKSLYQTLVAKVEATLKNKPKLQTRMDRIAHLFVVSVLCFSVATFLYWFKKEASFDHAFVAALSVLVIACPCALGMAVPLAFLTGVLRANRKGLLIHSLEAVHKAADIDMIAFDKTGTLTQGRPSVTRFKSAENISHRDLLIWGASLEVDSNHPYARAILEKAAADKAAVLTAKSLHVEPGKGVRGSLVIDGKEMAAVIGNLTWLFENGYDSTAVPADFQWEAEGTHETVLWLGIDKKYMGLIFLEDALRPEAKEICQELSQAGYQLGMITGDSENVGKAMAKQLTLKFYHAGVLPEEKATIVKRLSEPKKKGMDMITEEVCFIGDGVNDAPALAASHLGVAMGSGAALTQTSADIILVSNDLRAIPELFSELKSIRRLIHQNLALSFAYNIVAIPLASGLLFKWIPFSLNPEISALAMGLSSIAVAANSLRVLTAKQSS